jgi:hypothetical protein
MKTAAYILFFLGGIICLVNLYLSPGRYLIYRMSGKKQKKIQWVSGIPVFGSLFVAVSLIVLYGTTWVLISGILLIMSDSGGFHAFVGSLLYQKLKKD